MDYIQAKAHKAALEMAHDAAAIRLRLVSGNERGMMGLTPDHIKATPEWRKAFNDQRKAFREMADFNRHFAKMFKKELMAEYKARRIGIIMAKIA